MNDTMIRALESMFDVYLGCARAASSTVHALQALLACSAAARKKAQQKIILVITPVNPDYYFYTIINISSYKAESISLYSSIIKLYMRASHEFNTLQNM